MCFFTIALLHYRVLFDFATRGPSQIASASELCSEGMPWLQLEILERRTGCGRRRSLEKSIWEVFFAGFVSVSADFLLFAGYVL